MRNRYEVTCYKCGCYVPVGFGFFERHKGHWRVQCAKCCADRIVHETDKEVLRAKKLKAENEGYKMIKDADKVMEMAKDIINLKLQLIKSSIGRENCPFAVSPLKTHLDIDCSTIDCRDCDVIWAKAKRKEITEEVMTHYGLQVKVTNNDGETYTHI